MSANSERNARIVAARLAGMWPREIAEQLGLTKNVVIGVCDRAGLAGLSPTAERDGLRAAIIAGRIPGRLNPEAVREIRRRYKKGSRGPDGTAALASEFAVSRLSIHKVTIGASWADLPSEGVSA